MHSPPYGGKLDLTDANIKAGSKAIGKQIEKVQPILTLHGHIHESPLKSSCWIEKIGRTISINPGMGDKLQAVFIELDILGNVKSIEHSTLGLP